MRIWSLHPKYLDTKGLVALWRESLLARKVLEGKTKGYKNHPQLKRFKNSCDTLKSINKYLEAVYQEAIKRGHHFNSNKIIIQPDTILLTVTRGQMEFEKQHLLNKLKYRDTGKYEELLREDNPECNPLFKITEGGIEDWEIF